MLEATAVRHDQGYCFECCSPPKSLGYIPETRLKTLIFQELEPGKWKLIEEIEIQYEA